MVAILACHGRRETTLACLGRLFACERGDIGLDVVLVDDASPDGTADAVRERFPSVVVVRGSGQLWWAGAMHLAWETAQLSAPEYVLWLNDDVALDREALVRLVAAAQADPGAIIVGAVRDPVSGAMSYGGQRRVDWHPFRLASVGLHDRAVECDTFQGNVVLVPATVARALGRIDPAFVGVQGMADTDYGLRAKAAGLRIVQAAGNVGTCAPNDASPAWREGRSTLARRLAAVFGPRGFPPKAWLVFARRHGGRIWPLLLLSVYVFAVAGAFRPVPGRRPWRVAFCEGLVADYRAPFLRRLADRKEMALTAFVGQDKPGVSVANTDQELGAPVRRGRNAFWPMAGPRHAWSAGSCAAIVERFDAVLASFHPHEASVWLLVLSRLVLGRPRLVLLGHFRRSDGRRSPVEHLRQVARRLLARCADAVLPYTPGGARSCAVWGVRRDRIFVLSNSLDVAAIRRVQAAPDDVEQVRRDLGIARTAAVFAFVGRWIASRRLDLAVEAVERVRSTGRDAHLVLVGDGPERPTLLAKAASASGVHFLPATNDEARLAPVFEAALAVVIPDAAGLLVVHAFARGRPVITSRAGRSHGPEIEYASDGVNALLVEPLGAQAMADAMIRLIDDRALGAQLSQGAARTADRLGIEAMVEATAAAVHRAVCGYSPAYVADDGSR